VDYFEGINICNPNAMASDETSFSTIKSLYR